MIKLNNNFAEAFLNKALILIEKNSLKEAEDFVKDNPSFNLIKPTSNFVVFDPSEVQILEKNSQPVSRKELIEKQINKLKD